MKPPLYPVTAALALATACQQVPWVEDARGTENEDEDPARVDLGIVDPTLDVETSESGVDCPGGCADGQLCVDGICVDSCEVRADCADGESCVADLCIPSECEDDSSCGEGELCNANGLCINAVLPPKCDLPFSATLQRGPVIDPVTALIALDSNGDGVDELALISAAAPTTVQILRSGSDGIEQVQFLRTGGRTGGSRTGGSLAPQWAGRGDFDGDGNQDLALLADGWLFWALQREEGLAAPETLGPLGDGILGATVGDFDHNGASDLATIGGTPWAVLADGMGGVKPDQDYINAPGGDFIIALRRTEPGDTLLAVGGYQTEYLTGGDPPFNESFFSSGCENIHAIAAADFTGSGRQRAVLFTDLDGLDGLHIDAPGTTPFAHMGRVLGAQVLDLNLDGREDLVAFTAQGTLELFWGAPEPTLIDCQSSIALERPATDLALGDFNGDTQPDLAVRIETGELQILELTP